MAKIKTVELVGPMGRVVVNESDLESFLAREGYELPEAEVEEPEFDEDEEDEDED